MDEKDTTANAQQKLNPSQPGQNDQQVKQRRVRFIEEGVKTQYAAVFNIGFGAEEVLFLFGNPSLDPNIVRIESKVAVSLKTAKRVAVMLSGMIRQYEARNGAIDISAPKAASNESPKLQ